MMIGAIEAGGTKFVCAVGNTVGEIRESVKFSTRGPQETLNDVIDFFKNKEIDGLVIGSFGPVVINKFKNDYGCIKDTPKLLWKNFNLVLYIKKYLKVEIILTTDVNIAAYGEYVFGNGKGYKNIFYSTIGTGIGGGFIQNGNIFSGDSHLESGHILLPKESEDLDFKGVCPYHDGCFEGLASGPSIEARLGKEGFEIKKDNPVWDLLARYIAKACVNYTLTLSPDILIFGGSVSSQQQLYPKVRKYFLRDMNNYVDIIDVDKYIIPAKLGNDAGIKGCLAFGRTRFAR
ncbi:ROK family protein [Lactobacillus sp. UCMA15818]|uniref:ROK family protein n=1 Tax=Lactobacillus sp. UCMA15818 TaxID=2583394 RepID=UPI0025B023D5|nr:ROK family protein [Lactobacillus sp. UCMA15818]MDN2453718.1 ROK family protein [Lactobacillus sp. UCMA15818]